jgi:hypothetical protein
MEGIANKAIRCWRQGILIAGVLLACCILLGDVRGAGAQSTRNGSTQIPPPVIGGPRMDPLDMPPVYGGNEDPLKVKAEERRLAALSAERQKTLVADTNRLVKLAADLNAQVNSENHSQLTPDEARQLAEIEKLAHSIRDRMSATFNSPSTGAGMDGPVFMPR